MRRIVLVTVCAALLAASPAEAGVAAGRWTGHYGTGGSKVSFTVKGTTLKNFSAFVESYCGWNNTFTAQTFIVPKAPIRNGKVKFTYKITDSHGNVIGRDHLTATFHGNHVSGTLGGSDTGCTVATYKWTAHR